MARPKQQVNEENKQDIYQYFSVFFSENRYAYRNKRSYRKKDASHLFKDGSGNLIETPYKSQDAFKLIDSYPIDVVKLQCWVDDYISEYLWKMCLNSLYQKKFTLHSKRLHTIKITPDARRTLNYCMVKVNMTVEELMDKAIDLLYNELITKK